MSAGGISYSGLVNHGKITLPSVDTWGSNMNILRDPPKSVFTRKIDKVGETSSITQAVDESGNRSCEAINVYARGINPFVSVSYSNHGNNGGQRSGGITNAISSCNQAASLPYTVMRDGAFRPPVLRQEQLLPLSRLPRNITSATTTPECIDFSKKLRNCGTSENTKEVKTNIIKTTVKPTATYKLEKPLQEPFELIKISTQPVIKVSADSGIRTMDITNNKNIVAPTKEISEPLHILANAKLSFNKHVNNNEMETDRYLQNIFYNNVISKQSTNQHQLPTQELDTNRYIQEIQHNDVMSKYSANKHVNNNEMETDRYLQEAQHINVISKQSTNQHQLPTHELDTDRYLQETQHNDVMSKHSSNKYHTSIENILDLSDMPVHDNIITSNVDAVYSGPEQTKYFHDDITLERRLPEHQMTTNIVDKKVHKRIDNVNSIELERNTPNTNFQNNYVQKGNTDHSSREAKLVDKIQPGGFENCGVKPQTKRIEHGISNNFVSEKAKMNKIISESMLGRFSQKAPFK